MVEETSKVAAFLDIDTSQSGFGSTYTVFVPSNASWEAHSASMAGYAASALDQVVQAHVVPEFVWYSTSLPNQLRSFNLHDIDVDRHRGFSMNQNFSIVASDIPLENGVMHVIDR